MKVDLDLYYVMTNSFTKFKLISKYTAEKNLEKLK